MNTNPTNNNKNGLAMSWLHSNGKIMPIVAAGTALAGMALFAPAARATLLAYDGFDYPAGTAVGTPHANTLDGGFGWSTGWGSYNAGPPYSTVQSTGLTYGSLATTGLSLALGTGASRTLASNVAADFNSNGNVVGTLWMSMLVQPENGTSSTNFQIISFGQSGTSSTNSDFYNGSVDLGDFGGVYSLGSNGTGSHATTVAAADGTTALLVLEFQFDNAATTETLYVDPTPGLSAPNPGAATASQNFGIELNSSINLGNSSNWIADELRFGTTYADVAPSVPEPASLALMAAGGLGILLLGRRHGRPS